MNMPTEIYEKNCKQCYALTDCMALGISCRKVIAMTEQDKTIQELRRTVNELAHSNEFLKKMNGELAERVIKNHIEASEAFALYEKAITVYGDKAQTVVAMEEMAELIKELSKTYRGKANPDAIIEEMADVYIMLDQLKIIFKISEDDIEAMMTVKNNRLEERLANAK